MAKVKRSARLVAVASLVLIALLAVGMAGASGDFARARVAPESDDAPVELTGPVSSRTDAEGDREYTIEVDGKAIDLDAGPRWFHGDKHPLEPFVGETVTVTGDRGVRQKPERARRSEVDVRTVASDGKKIEIRPAGKPPWAGGPSVVGKKHPGYEGWSRGQANRADK